DDAELLFTNIGGKLNRVTFNGDMDLVTFVLAKATLINGLTLNGTAHLGGDDARFSSSLSFQDTQTLGGAATIVFGASSSNGLSITGAASSMLTIAPGVVIRGQKGTIGSSGFALDNQGLIVADVSGGILNLQGTWTNHGTFGASNGATLTLKDTGTWS